MAIVIVAVLVALAIRGCQASAPNTALTEYTGSVAALIAQSDQLSDPLFSALSRGAGASGATSIQHEINRLGDVADSQLGRAGGLHAPGQLKPAQRNLLLALRLRRDALANITSEIRPAFATSTSRQAMDAIAGAIGRLHTSDVIYKDYTLPIIVAALHTAGITVGGAIGASLEGRPFVPALAWLTPGFVAANLGAPLPAGKPAPGAHGDRMDSVSVDGTTLQTGAANTIEASPPPTFTCTFTNDGQDPETDVVVRVSITGTPLRAQAVVAHTTSGQQATAHLTLGAPPPRGSFTLTATVERVPGETVLTHNTLSFPVTFK